MSGAIEQANRRASDSVLISGFLVVLGNSAMYEKVQGEGWRPLPIDRDSSGVGSIDFSRRGGGL